MWRGGAGYRTGGEGDPCRQPYAREIQFAGNDVLDGDVHFNDSPLMGSAGGLGRNSSKVFRWPIRIAPRKRGTPDDNG